MPHILVSRRQLADDFRCLCSGAAEVGDAVHYVNLYDRQLPGDHRTQLEHGLWQTSW